MGRADGHGRSVYLRHTYTFSLEGPEGGHAARPHTDLTDERSALDHPRLDENFVLFDGDVVQRLLGRALVTYHIGVQVTLHRL